MGAAGCGGHRHRLFILCPGAGKWGRNVSDDFDGAVRLPLHPHGGSQHPELSALRCLLPVPAPAVLRVEGAKILNRKQKKELRRHLSTRQLMGIDQLTAHGLKTARGELVFYLDSPDNLSVLSAEGGPGPRPCLDGAAAGHGVGGTAGGVLPAGRDHGAV